MTEYELHSFQEYLKNYSVSNQTKDFAQIPLFIIHKKYF